MVPPPRSDTAHTAHRDSREPADPAAFTRRFDRAYTATAGLYDLAVRRLPVWRRWLERALPHVVGPRVLELSFGTGHLLTRLDPGLELHGVDLNRRMVDIARRNLAAVGGHASLVQANVERLPYRDGCFDTLVNTMAFSGYPKAEAALAEMVRVVRPGGRLVLIDVGWPLEPDRLGSALAFLWQAAGDLLRDMRPLFERHGLATTHETVGGRGSVQLWVATRPESA